MRTSVGFQNRKTEMDCLHEQGLKDCASSILVSSLKSYLCRTEYRKAWSSASQKRSVICWYTGKAEFGFIVRSLLVREESANIQSDLNRTLSKREPQRVKHGRQRSPSFVRYMRYQSISLIITFNLTDDSNLTKYKLRLCDQIRQNLLVNVYDTRHLLILCDRNSDRDCCKTQLFQRLVNNQYFVWWSVCESNDRQHFVRLQHYSPKRFR